jgi:hypothetical protein
MNQEEQRLKEAREEKISWKKWGPYLSERQWGTVREDYSENGDAWNFLPMNRPVPGHTAGVRMASPEYPTTSNGSALPSHCGTARTRSSRNASSD